MIFLNKAPKVEEPPQENPIVTPVFTKNKNILPESITNPKENVKEPEERSIKIEDF